MDVSSAVEIPQGLSRAAFARNDIAICALSAFDAIVATTRLIHSHMIDREALTSGIFGLIIGAMRCGAQAIRAAQTRARREFAWREYCAVQSAHPCGVYADRTFDGLANRRG